MLPTLTIGSLVTYLGSRHPAIYGSMVQVVAVYKGYFPNPDGASVVRTANELAERGGIVADADLIEVAPFSGRHMS